MIRLKIALAFASLVLVLGCRRRDGGVALIKAADQVGIGELAAQAAADKVVNLETQVNNLSLQNDSLHTTIRNYEKQREAVRGVFEKEFKDLTSKKMVEIEKLKTQIEKEAKGFIEKAKDAEDAAKERERAADNLAKQFKDREDAVIQQMKLDLAAANSAREKAEEAEKAAAIELEKAKKISSKLVRDQKEKFENSSKMVQALVVWRENLLKKMTENLKELNRLDKNYLSGNFDRDLTSRKAREKLFQMEGLVSQMKRMDPEVYKEDAEMAKNFSDYQEQVELWKKRR